MTTTLHSARNTGQRRRAKSWLPGQKGQGGEGLSKGYGGSAGKGVGGSGADDGKRLRPRGQNAGGASRRRARDKV